MDREYGGREPDQPRGHLAVERGKPLEAPVEAVEEGHERSRKGDRRSDGNGGNRCHSKAQYSFHCCFKIITRRRCGASTHNPATHKSHYPLSVCCRMQYTPGGE